MPSLFPSGVVSKRNEPVSISLHLCDLDDDDDFLLFGDTYEVARGENGDLSLSFNISGEGRMIWFFNTGVIDDEGASIYLQWKEVRLKLEKEGAVTSASKSNTTVICTIGFPRSSV